MDKGEKTDNQEIYLLGNFKFKTKEEYEQAKIELNRISILKKKFDFDNPDSAKKLLKAISERPELFKTAVGSALIRKLKRTLDINMTEKHNQIPKASVKKNESDKKASKKCMEKSDEEEERTVLPIIKEAGPVTNFLFTVAFFLSFFLSFYSVRSDEISLEMVVTYYIMVMLTIGIVNLCGIRRRKKKADKYIYAHLSEAQKNAMNDAKAEEEKNQSMCLFPKLKWLLYNLKSGLALVLYFLGFCMAGGVQELYEQDYDSTMPLIPAFLITVVFAVATYTLIVRWHKRQFYLAICNMASFPIMLFFAMLPFAAFGAMMYIRANMNEITGIGGNPNGGVGPDFVYDVPPVYEVAGYSYYNSRGTLVVVGPYNRTMPDASIYNNLGYRG